MKALKPKGRILRCYGHPTEKGNLVGVCIDLNLAVEADSPKELQKKMSEVINLYIKSVLDTDDKKSIPRLLYRRAPLRNWVIYYFIKCCLSIHDISKKFTFNEYMPGNLAHDCR